MTALFWSIIQIIETENLNQIKYKCFNAIDIDKSLKRMHCIYNFVAASFPWQPKHQETHKHIDEERIDREKKKKKKKSESPSKSKEANWCNNSDN